MKERARLAAAHEFEEEFNAWRKKVFPSVEKGIFTHFWMPMHIYCATDLSRWFTQAQFALSDIFEKFEGSIFEGMKKK